MSLTNKSRFRRWTNLAKWGMLAMLAVLLVLLACLMCGVLPVFALDMKIGLPLMAVLVVCLALVLQHRSRSVHARKIAAGFAKARNGRIAWDKLAEDADTGDVKQAVEQLCRQGYLAKTRPWKATVDQGNALVPESVYCAKCGAPLPPGAAGTYRCEYCGHMPGSEML